MKTNRSIKLSLLLSLFSTATLVKSEAKASQSANKKSSSKILWKFATWKKEVEDIAAKIPTAETDAKLDTILKELDAKADQYVVSPLSSKTKKNNIIKQKKQIINNRRKELAQKSSAPSASRKNSVSSTTSKAAVPAKRASVSSNRK